MPHLKHHRVVRDTVLHIVCRDLTESIASDPAVLQQEQRADHLGEDPRTGSAPQVSYTATAVSGEDSERIFEKHYWRH